MHDYHEEWKPVSRFDGAYEVSCLGRVKRIKPAGGARVGCVLKPMLGTSGYYHVGPSIDGKNITCYVHHLVAEEFLGPRPEGNDVNHIDGDKINNRAANLEYVTRAGNHRHAICLGLWDCRIGNNHPNAKLTEEAVREIRRLSGRMSAEGIAALFGVSRTTVSDAVVGRTWRHVT